MTDCFLGIMIPERIAEKVILKTNSGQVIAESIYDIEDKVIPKVASKCIGDYELFYAKTNPQIGIDILKMDLKKAKNKNHLHPRSSPSS